MSGNKGVTVAVTHTHRYTHPLLCQLSPCLLPQLWLYIKQPLISHTNTQAHVADTDGHTRLGWFGDPGFYQNSLSSHATDWQSALLGALWWRHTTRDSSVSSCCTQTRCMSSRLLWIINQGLIFKILTLVLSINYQEESLVTFVFFFLLLHRDSLPSLYFTHATPVHRNAFCFSDRCLVPPLHSPPTLHPPSLRALSSPFNLLTSKLCPGPLTLRCPPIIYLSPVSFSFKHMLRPCPPLTVFTHWQARALPAWSARSSAIDASSATVLLVALPCL